MSFNPITDLRLNSDDKIEDAPAVNIEVELLPVLRRTTSKTKQVANVIKSNNSLLKNDLERITTLRRRLQRVIPVIPRNKERNRNKERKRKRIRTRNI